MFGRDFTSASVFETAFHSDQNDRRLHLVGENSRHVPAAKTSIYNIVFKCVFLAKILKKSSKKIVFFAAGKMSGIKCIYT